MRSASPDGGDPDVAGPGANSQEIIGCIHHSCVLICVDPIGPAHTPRMLGIPKPKHISHKPFSAGIGQLRSMFAAPRFFKPLAKPTQNSS